MGNYDFDWIFDFDAENNEFQSEGWRMEKYPKINHNTTMIDLMRVKLSCVKNKQSIAYFCRYNDSGIIGPKNLIVVLNVA